MAGMMKRVMRLKPIGIVHSPFREPALCDADKFISEIRIDPRWAKALKGIEGFSHIIVLFYLDRSRGVDLQVHPRRRMDLPLVGLFASRTPRRPNPIGLTVCRLLKRRGTRLTVQGLDAFDGTPVLDIKPYIPDNDLVKRARVPNWIKQLRNR
jgi:tRNA-Thr(GGU) m(6)t(6)A37 methyltransferase TsaA